MTSQCARVDHCISWSETNTSIICSALRVTSCITAKCLPESGGSASVTSFETGTSMSSVTHSMQHSCGVMRGKENKQNTANTYTTPEYSASKLAQTPTDSDVTRSTCNSSCRKRSAIRTSSFFSVSGTNNFTLQHPNDAHTAQHFHSVNILRPEVLLSAPSLALIRFSTTTPFTTPDVLKPTPWKHKAKERNPSHRILEPHPSRAFLPSATAALNVPEEC